MPLDKSDTERALCRKGFEKHEGPRHHRFVYHTISGKKTERFTETSRSKGKKDLGDSLVATMARQVGLRRADFEDLARCPLSRERYEEKLVEAGHLGADE